MRLAIKTANPEAEGNSSKAKLVEPEDSGQVKGELIRGKKISREPFELKGKGKTKRLPRNPRISSATVINKPGGEAVLWHPEKDMVTGERNPQPGDSDNGDSAKHSGLGGKAVQNTDDGHRVRDAAPRATK